MRIIPFTIALIVTIALVLVLNNAIGGLPPLGRFISPQHGFWQNAEPASMNFSSELNFPSLQKDADVYFDDRMVPHVFVEEENDAFFIQGIPSCEIPPLANGISNSCCGRKVNRNIRRRARFAYLNNDRNMRRLGMVYAARRSLLEMEKDDATRTQLDAYTAGVNAYIGQLTTATLPLEYRLLNYYPEKWTNLKTALFLKYMSYDLTGAESDIEYTNAKAFFSKEDFDKLYPVFHDSLDPVIPRGTIYPSPSILPQTPATADSLYFNWKAPATAEPVKPDRNNGSNNWAVNGSKTKSGRPILCNDPHLGLNLPSLWYEMQISTPAYNAYGVSFPGAPAIIIGFNDSIAWGVTNAERDVKDFYNIEFKDATRAQYRFNNQWKNAELQVEKYLMKDGSSFYDTVAYTVFGPVMYDDRFNGNGRVSNLNLAVRWSAHDPTNELKTFSLLDKAKNYSDYENAISSFSCPGQNFVFASKTGTIALWQQGKFPAKWKYQGDFIMPGNDSSYSWQGYIPHEENPHIIDPARGFVSSANQAPADSAYPYFLSGSFDLYRGFIINRYLSRMWNITTDDMQKMQTDNYNVFAEMMLPLLLKHINSPALDDNEKKALDIINRWNYRNDSEEQGPVIFTVWTDELEQLVWGDELSRQRPPYEMPQSATLLDALLKDTSFSFIDNVNTPVKENLTDIVTAAFKKSAAVFVKAEESAKNTWAIFKDAGLRHLLRIEPFSRYHLNIGGGENIINATKQFHGPSWRMIVELTDSVNAYGVYPGGQSGNPGSKYYDGFVDSWTNGRYYKLWMMKKGEENSGNIQFKMHFTHQ